MRLSGQRGSLKQRAFALGIAVCLAFPPQGNVQAAQMTAGEWPAAFFPADLREIKVPSNIGSLEEVHQGRDERLVILVQDAHSIPTAQRSIRNLIDFFQQTYGLDTVAVEGARAELDPQIFRSFPDREKLKAVFSQYLEAGELTGTTFAAVFNRQEAEYRAIEDWPLFEKGYSFYLSALDRAAEAESVMAVLEKALEHQKEQLYSPGLLRVDRAIRDFRAHSANLIDVLETLASVKPPEPGSELALMLEENSRTEETRLPLELEVKSISEKIRKYFQSHPSSGGSPAVAEFNAKLQAFQTSRLTAEQFAVYLKDLAKEMKFPVKFSGDFQSRVKRQMKIEDIDGTRFFESFERYAASVKEELFRSDSERELETQTARLYLLQRLRSLELTREQWHQLKNYARRGQFSGPNHIFLEESDLERLMPEAELRRLLDVNLLFYENAELRDSVFAENLEKMLASRPKSPTGAENKAVMLVSGGFHTEGVLKLLKDKGISYLLLMPKIEALPETVHYKDHMQGLVSWRDYLEVEPGGGVNTYNAFVRAARDRLKQDHQNSESGALNQNPVVIKEWRDQIIRDLSKKGKTAEAARYTRFMDETAQEGGKPGASGSLLQKVDSFVSGLKELEARGQLTEPNVLRLLRPSGIAPGLPTNALVPRLIKLQTEVKDAKAAVAMDRLPEMLTGQNQVANLGRTLSEILTSKDFPASLRSELRFAADALLDFEKAQAEGRVTLVEGAEDLELSVGDLRIQLGKKTEKGGFGTVRTTSPDANGDIYAVKFVDWAPSYAARETALQDTAERDPTATVDLSPAEDIAPDRRSQSAFHMLKRAEAIMAYLHNSENAEKKFPVPKHVGSGAFKNGYYIVMKNPAGQPLNEARKQLSLSERLDVYKAWGAENFRILNDAGIAPQDIKAANFFLNGKREDGTYGFTLIDNDGYLPLDERDLFPYLTNLPEDHPLKTAFEDGWFDGFFVQSAPTGFNALSAHDRGYPEFNKYMGVALTAKDGGVPESRVIAIREMIYGFSTFYQYLKNIYPFVFFDEAQQTVGGRLWNYSGANSDNYAEDFFEGLSPSQSRRVAEILSEIKALEYFDMPYSETDDFEARLKNYVPEKFKLLNEKVEELQRLAAERGKRPQPARTEMYGGEDTFVPEAAQMKTGKAGDTLLFARSELRSENDDGKLSPEEASKLLSYLSKAWQERMAGLDDSYVMYSDIYRVLQLAQEENRGYLRYALNHGDFIYQYAEYLAGLGYKLDPALRDDILTLNRIVDSVMAGENSESEARAGLDRLSRERDYPLLNTAVHRLAEKLESAEGESEARLTAFLSRYVRDELQSHGPLAASFAGYLIEEHLEKGNVLVYLGRGTEQMQQILEGALADRLQTYRGQIFELLVSTEMMNSHSRAEILEYLRFLGVPLDKKIIFIDTGFAATIARPMAEIVNETGGNSEFCLYCYVKPTPGLIGKIKRQLSYFFPQARTLGIGFNEVSALFRANEDAYLSAAHFFDDLLGKRVEKVWRLQNGVPVTEPTRTGKFYRISRDAVQDWIDRQTNMNARSELRSQEGDEAMQVYLNLIAWRVSSVLERGLLRPMTARAMIASGEIPVPEELSSALLPFGVDVRQLLFASSADAKLAPEAYEENDKGALVVIEDIQNPSVFTDASYYEDYEDYIRIKVRGLTQGSPYRSPVSVIAERDFSDVQLELEARGAEVLNERLGNSGMVLLSTDKPFEVLEEESEYRDGPNILGFRQIGPEQIEAFFVPEGIYGRVVELLPEALRAKVVPVSGKKNLREMDGHAPEGLMAPSWDEALAAFLKNYPWEGRSARNFMLHGTRFDTPSEIQNRIEKRSELRNVSDEDYARVAQEAERIRLLVENHSAIRSEPPYTKGTGDIVKALAEARDLSAQRGDMGRIAAIVQEANSWYPQRVKATLQAIDDQTIKPSIKQQFAVFSREVQRILKRAEEAGGRSELRTDSEDSASSSRGLKALDVENQIFPIIDALSNHPDEFQHPNSEEEKAIWNFLQERLLLQDNLYGDSADLSAIAGLFLKPSAEGERLIESRYPGILSTESRDTLRLTGPVMTVRDLGFGMNRFAYTVTVNRGGAESVFYAKVDNRDIGKKRDSLKESSTYLEMKNQQLLEEKFADIPAGERPYAEQFMTVRVDIEHSESSPSAASKTSSRWVQYGHLVEGRDLEKVMKSLRPDRAGDSGPVRVLSFSLGEMAGKLFFQTMNKNFEGWFFGDMKAANVAQTLAGRPVILNIDSELLLVPPEQFDKNLTPGAKPHAAFTARQELAQIPYKVILEPLGQEQIFLPAATGETSPELVSEAQIANLFLAGFLAPIKADADWAAKAEAATGITLTSAMRESIESVWAQADAIDEGTSENFETLDLAGLEEGGDWMRRRLDEAGVSAAARSELRDDSPVLRDGNSLSGLAWTAGKNLIRFYREEDASGLGLSVAQAVTRGAAVNFEEFLDAMIRSVEDSLGSEAESYSQLILDAMRDIAAKVKEAGYSQKKGVFVLSPSAERSELDLTQVNAYKDAVRQASGFIDSLYYRFKDNAVLREAVREAGIQHFQPVSTFSSIRAPEDVPALPLLTSSDEKQEARSTIPFMQIGIFYPDNFERGDSSAIEETFAVFMQFVFGYVAQNKLSRSDFEFLNQLQVIASESKTGEDVMDLYDRKYSAEGSLKARARVDFIKAALIQPLTEILGEAAPQLLGGLELGSPGILVGQIAESMKAYEAVRTSA